MKIKTDWSLTTPKMTEGEIVELQELQEIAEAAPSMTSEIFKDNNLGARFLMLKQKKTMQDFNNGAGVDEYISALAKEISNDIDAQMMKIFNETTITTATDPISIANLKALLNTP